MLCDKCGSMNAPSVKFCVNCGTALSKSSQPAPAPVVEYTNNPVADAKKSSVNTWILAAILLIGTGTAAYFIFFNKKDKEPEVNTAGVVSSSKDDTASTPVAADPVPADSKPKPLNVPAPTVVEVEITQEEIDAVSARVQEFYNYENDENVTQLMTYYQFPLDRYYNLYNVSYDKLHSMIISAFNEQLYYHHIDIKWNYGTVQKQSNGNFRVKLFAEYTSSKEDESDRKTRNLELIIILNERHKITSIHEA